MREWARDTADRLVLRYAKDKRSIRFDAFLAGRKDQIGGRNEPNGTANKAWEVVN